MWLNKHGCERGTVSVCAVLWGRGQWLGQGLIVLKTSMFFICQCDEFHLRVSVSLHFTVSPQDNTASPSGLSVTIIVVLWAFVSLLPIRSCASVLNILVYFILLRKDRGLWYGSTGRDFCSWRQRFTWGLVHPLSGRLKKGNKSLPRTVKATDYMKRLQHNWL